MSYARVIPRDLFNESSLLKCCGRLYIVLEGVKCGSTVGFQDDDLQGGFDIVQREDDGSIYIANLPFEIGGDLYRLTRPLNSRQPWPLYAEKIGDPEFEPVPLFDTTGNLTRDARQLLGCEFA